MTRISIAVVALSLTFPLAAQEVPAKGPRADHYIDHLVLGIDDLDKGADEFLRLTGVKPKFDGRDPLRGTRSALIGLGDGTFLEIMAPDPKANPSTLEPELRALFLDRLVKFDTLTPFRWAVGTGNLEKSVWLVRRIGSHMTDIANGTRKRGWGRSLEWEWSRIQRPDLPVTPIFVQWKAGSQPPQERAPEGCSLTGLEIQSRNFKTIQALLAALQLDVGVVGADDDALAFALDCEGREVRFEPVSLNDEIPVPERPGH